MVSEYGTMTRRSTLAGWKKSIQDQAMFYDQPEQLPQRSSHKMIPIIQTSAMTIQVISIAMTIQVTSIVMLNHKQRLLTM